MLFLLALGGILLFQHTRPKGGFAEIVQDGVVQVVPLSEDGIFGLESDPSIQFEVKNGAIRFIRADCPDKICEKAGFLSKTGQTAACLPRKTVLTIISSEEEGADAVAE